LGNKDNEFSVKNTSSKRIELVEEIVHLAEDIVISYGVVVNVIFEGGLESLTVDIDSDCSVQSGLIIGGIFTVLDGLDKGQKV
jgi:hypothetical protein